MSTCGEQVALARRVSLFLPFVTFTHLQVLSPSDEFRPSPSSKKKDWILCPLLTPAFTCLSSALARASDNSDPCRPPGVSHPSFYQSCRIYSLEFRVTIGRPDSGLGYPLKQAFYPVSVRQNWYLSPASFRSALASDTLAFDYEIPVTTAPKGLKGLYLRTSMSDGMPGTPIMPPLSG